MIHRAKFIITILIAVIGVLTHSSNAFAQAKPKKKTAINFEDQLVTGELRKPELMYLMQKKQFNFGRLIKLRENFLPEMRKTSENIQRGGQ